jgi:hypothetical protein
VTINSMVLFAVMQITPVIYSTTLSHSPKVQDRTQLFMHFIK